MSPVLFFVPSEKFTQIPAHLPELIVASFFTMLSLFFYFFAIKYIPLGISSALRTGFWVFVMALLGIIFLNNVITPSQWILITGVVIFNSWLGILKSDFSHLQPGKHWLSFLASIVSALCFAFGFFLMGKVSIELSPFLSGYIWEVSIGIFACIASYVFGEFKEKKFSWNNYLKMALFASPTIASTVLGAIAMTLGPIGIFSAIQTGSIIVITIFGALFLGENLRWLQWLLVVAMMICIVGFKIF